MAYAGFMKKFLKFIVWMGGVAIFLLVTAHFTLRHLLNAPKFRTAATGFVERVTGRAADYERIDYTLFPFSLSIRNAALREKDGSGDFASMGRLAVEMDFRNREITAVRLEEPTLRLVQKADGSYNISDWLPTPESEAPAGGTPPPAETPADSGPTTAPGTTAGPSAPAPLVLRLLAIENARVEFVRESAGGEPATFTLSNLDLRWANVAADRPLQLDGRVAIGRASGAEFHLSGPAPAEHADDPGGWPLLLQAQLDLRDPRDIEAFMPAGEFPVQELHARLEIRGALAEKWNLLFEIQAQPAPAAGRPLALEASLRAEASLPAAALQRLQAGAPASAPPAPEPCTPPPGGVWLGRDPDLAELLKSLQVTATLALPRLAWGQNEFTRGEAALFLHNGVLTIPGAKGQAYGGTLEARGNLQLLACPLAYRLDRLVLTDLALADVVAANGLDPLLSLSGRLQGEASATGQAVAGTGLRALVADAQLNIAGLQTVGPGGSLLDRVWLQLDQPLLLRLVPGLAPKVAQARLAEHQVTTTRYDTATASLSLRNGAAALSGTRLATADYRLDLAGAVWPFDQRLELAAKLVASPAESARLTENRDLAAYLPYEDGGLLVPFTIRGPWQDPEIRPDLDRLLQNAVAGLAGDAGGGLEKKLENLDDADRRQVQKGLEFLGTLLQSAP